MMQDQKPTFEEAMRELSALAKFELLTDENKAKVIRQIEILEAHQASHQ